MAAVYFERAGVVAEQEVGGARWREFVNHSQISPIICDKDEDILSYMTNLQVVKLKHPRNRFKIRLFFRSNPYFSKTVIVKEYRDNINGYRAYRSSPIKWLQGYMGEAPRSMAYNNSVSIFNWLVDHDFVDSSRIAEVVAHWGKF
ncbi:testis-specific Y-encoded protein 3-like [Ochotona curzoniae]|uniref:testis-specific Y-encoded protein 3-like n=1 Tax=Ochotona curzoniae TaxID=130825 RepID=UPI001B353702|nr:testis-specific Y-encoded protein 3-like [Ochotona curzoniae]